MALAEQLATQLDAPGGLLGSATGELTLRVCRGGRAQQIVRVSSQKCSLGSGADCTLRLHEPGIEPWHCLILRGRSQTIVRNLARDTLLNNRPFGDAQLKSGDWLTLGSLQVQVIAPGVPRAGKRFDALACEPAMAAPQIRQSEVAELAAMRARLELANRQGRQRARQLVTRFRKLERRLKDLDARRQQQASEASALAERLNAWNVQRAEIGHRLAQLERDEQALRDNRTSWQAEVQELEQRLAERDAALANEAEQLRQQAGALTTERATLHTLEQQHHADHKLRQAVIEERQRSIDELAAAHAASRDEHVHVRLQWESERREAEARLARREAELTARLACAESQRAALETRERQLQAATAALEVSKLEVDEQRADCQAEIAHQRAEVDRAACEMQEHVAALDARRIELADLSHELTARQTAFETAQQQLHDAQAAWAAERSTADATAQQELQHLVDERSAHVTELEAELASLRANRTETLPPAAGPDVQSQLSELAAQRNQLDADRRTLAEQQAALTAAQAELDEQRRGLEAERLHDYQDAEAAHAESAHLQSELQMLSAREAAVVSRTEELDRLSQQLDQRAHEMAHAERNRELEQVQSELQAEHSRRDELSQQLDTLRADFAAREERDQAERNAFAAQRDRQMAELQAQGDAISAEHATVQTERAALQAEQEAFLIEQQQLHAQLEALAARQAEEATDRQRLQQEFDEERIAFRDRREQIEQKLQERTSEVETRWAELETRQTEFEAWQAEQEAELVQAREQIDCQQRDSEDSREDVAESDAVNPPQPAEPGSLRQSTPLSSLALLTKMGLAIPTDDEQEQSPGEESGHQPPAPAPAPRPKAVVAEEEEDMEAYTARWLQNRMGVQPTPPAAPQTRSAAPAPSSSLPRENAAPSLETAVTIKRPERNSAPRALPPELTADLSAMREVANATARSAIKKHLHTTVSKKRNQDLTACLVMLALCGVLSWRHYEGMPWMLESAAGSGLMCALLFTKHIHSIRKFRKSQAEIDSRPAGTGPQPVLREGTSEEAASTDSAASETSAAEVPADAS